MTTTYNDIELTKDDTIPSLRTRLNELDIYRAYTERKMISPKMFDEFLEVNIRIQKVMKKKRNYEKQIVLLRCDLEKLESLERMKEWCHKVYGRSAREEAELENIVNGAPIPVDVSTDSDITREDFVALFVDPLFNRIEKNKNRLDEAKKLIKKGSPDYDEQTKAFDDMESKSDDICRHNASMMRVFIDKMAEKDSEQQKELDHLWDKMQELGLTQSE